MGDKKGIDIKKCKYKIVVDSREKVNKHILNKFEEGFEYKVSHHDMYRGKKSTYSDPVDYYIQEKGLKVGDYTIAVKTPTGEVINFKDKIVIERKADLNELCCNFFDKKDEEGKYITNIDEIVNGYAVRTPVLLYADGYKLVEKSKFKPKIEKGTESLPK